MRVKTIREKFKIKHKIRMRAMYFDVLTIVFIVISMINSLSIVKYRNKILKANQSGIQKIYVYTLI